MAENKPGLSRREFLASSAAALGAAGLSWTGPGRALGQQPPAKKHRVALVGTGGRGSSLWGKDLIKNYGDVLEMVGLCDINPIRLEYAKGRMGATCPTFSDFETMIKAEIMRLAKIIKDAKITVD